MKNLISILIMHASGKNANSNESEFFDLDRIFNDGFTHLRDPTSFFLNYQLISREQVC